VERAPFALEMLNISKTFPGVRALDDVTFSCARGEVHALCGENGAGKSTLIKILGGAYKPDRGRIILDGQEVEFSHPVASRRAGVSIIYQELSLLPHRSVAENIFLGIEPTRYGMLDRPASSHAALADSSRRAGSSGRCDSRHGLRAPARHHPTRCRLRRRSSSGGRGRFRHGRGFGLIASRPLDLSGPQRASICTTPITL
jgi:ABC-type Fe3+/spermidine/putrescine transport system ATPase subunit